MPWLFIETGIKLLGSREALFFSGHVSDVRQIEHMGALRHKPRTIKVPHYANTAAAYYVREGAGKLGLVTGGQRKEKDVSVGDVFV
eukprot:jgi/Mesen1/248/ME1143417C07607